jgi:hypothetical protein
MQALAEKQTEQGMPGSAVPRSVLGLAVRPPRGGSEAVARRRCVRGSGGDLGIVATGQQIVRAISVDRSESRLRIGPAVES